MSEGIQAEGLATDPEKLQDRRRREDRVEWVASVNGGNFVENLLKGSVNMNLPPAVARFQSPLKAVNLQLAAPNVLPEDAPRLRESQP